MYPDDGPRSDDELLAEVSLLAREGDVPDPGPDFEARMWSRIEPIIAADRAPRWGVRHWAAVAAWAAVIAGVVVGGWSWVRVEPPDRATTTTVTVESGPALRERVLWSALTAHFGETEVLLVELMNAPDSTPRPGFERLAADELVQAGRLYRVTATETGHGAVAAVLDEIETVLVEVARAPDEPSHADMAAWRERVQAADLLFKVRVAAETVRGRSEGETVPGRSDGSTPSTGGAL